MRLVNAVSDHPAEWVKKAAEAMALKDTEGWKRVPTYEDLARAVLDAVAPTILEHLEAKCSADNQALLDRQRADAWDEGKKAGRSDQSAQQIWAVTGGTRPTDTPNPYREVAQ